ncbi:serine hydroxymethyltransferase [Burkholderia pseudomultivorans]|uniref:serine hydroxymethyltransferase n=1 Tax=Burkholderia pseudomultivorans TaxID=1207504 RepID=UPI001FC89692|nr:aminotransferase class I/II-fold pyridoxal phosphate-dependent enzyme [Burkholderia pseudomultivorans]
MDRNARWRGRQCLNLVAAESPTSHAARALLSSEVGTRASGGHIGRDNRFFAGMRFIDELESLCVELLKKAFRVRYADHRLMGGMAATLVAYTALTQPGDRVMTAPLQMGGDTSNRTNGPPGVRGTRVIDIPYSVKDGSINLDEFATIARKERPAVTGLGMTLTLFPLPIREIKAIVSEWGGLVYFDGAHQLGLISAGLFQDPLGEGADVMTGSSGKTFSGPQGGIICWNTDRLADTIAETIFPVLTGSHQINRVAALAVAASEMLEYGPVYMRQVVANAQALAEFLHDRGINVLYAERGYTQTHQIVVDSRPAGSGRTAVRRLEAANIICNEMPLPWDSVETGGVETGIRLGTVEVTRRGMGVAEMEWIAERIAKVLHGSEATAIAPEVADFLGRFDTIYYCHEHGLPPR